MATKETIRNKALQKLGVLAIGATARAEVAQDLDDAYDEVYALLDSQQIAYFQQDDVPNEAVNAVAAKVAWTRVNDYLVSELRYQRLRVEAADADRAITAAKNGPYYGNQDNRDF